MENKMNTRLMQILKMANKKEIILYVLISVTGILLPGFLFTKIIMVEYLVALLLALLLVISLLFFLFEYKKTKSIRKELLKQAHANKIILNHLTEGIITTNQKGEIQFMNEVAEKLTGWEKQNATNQLLQKVFNVDHESSEGYFENVITRVLKNGKAIVNENHSILKTSDFKKINIINSGLPMLNGAGKITGAVLLFKPVAGEKESALKEKEEIYKTIIEQASDAIFINDTKGNLLEVNNSACSLLGYTKEQFAKMNITDLHTKEALLLKPIMYDKLLSGEKTRAERNLLHSNGSTVPVEITAKMLSDGRIMAIVRDITERKKAEKKIRDYRFALDESSIVDVSDSNGMILYVNENFCKISGYSKEELIGQDHKILSSKYHTTEFIKNLWDMVTAGQVWRNEVKNKAKDGSFYWVDTTVVPFLNEKGQPVQYITIRSNITKHKESEKEILETLERYDILSKATSDTIWDWDFVNNHMTYNDGITKLFGYQNDKVKNIYEWHENKIHPEDRQQITDLLQEGLKNKVQTIQFEYRFRCANNKYKAVYDRAFIIYDEDNQPKRMIGAMQDVHYQKEEEMRIGKAVIDIQEREREQIGMELHDNVNQILSATILYIGMAKEKMKKGLNGEDLLDSSKGFINDAINEIRRLSHQLAPASFINTSLRVVFESLVHNMNTDERFKANLNFDDLDNNNLSGDVPINLYRIIQEQLNNIKKYSGAKNVDISITVSDKKVQLRIADDGKGFDIKNVKKGIGLENIKRRTRVFAGEISINTAPGNGCEIIVELPIEAAEII